MYLVVFRNRKRADIDYPAYEADAARMLELAQAQPGYRSFKSYVADDGEGVPDAMRVRLFEPFGTGRADGTGLGLALAREVAIAHGGELRYEAGTPGARFILEMPWQTC